MSEQSDTKELIDLITKPKMGRPSKLTEETKKRLFEAILDCCTVRDACAYAGIGVTTYEEWKKQGEADIKAGKRSDYALFLKQCQDAFAMAKPRLEKVVRRGADKDPRLALTILERRYSGDWARKDEMEIGGSGGSGSITVRWGSVSRQKENVENEDTPRQNQRGLESDTPGERKEDEESDK